VQCSSCGNKWTQFPVKTTYKTNQKKTEIPKKISKEKKISKKIKSKKNTKKIGPTLYSKEYLQKKHGILINQENSTDTKPKESKKKSSSLGFYSYFLIFIIFIIFSFGILNLTKENIIINYPFLEIYINYIYETLLNIKVILEDLFANY
tara:strand:- start:18 stop:464 length:447 start_codon:yes stop_codon:yes gene_type:complete